MPMRLTAHAAALGSAASRRFVRLLCRPWLRRPSEESPYLAADMSQMGGSLFGSWHGELGKDTQQRNCEGADSGERTASTVPTASAKP